MFHRVNVFLIITRTTIYILALVFLRNSVIIFTRYSLAQKYGEAENKNLLNKIIVTHENTTWWWKKDDIQKQLHKSLLGSNYDSSSASVPAKIRKDGNQHESSSMKISFAFDMMRGKHGVEYFNPRTASTQETSSPSSNSSRQESNVPKQVFLSTIPFMDKVSTSQLPTIGFVILGMHRSGTSMLSGLLVKVFGYKIGEPQIWKKKHNKKGYFELLPVVEQNRMFLKGQGVRNPFASKKIRGFNASDVIDHIHDYNGTNILKDKTKQIALYRKAGKDLSKTPLQLALDELNNNATNIPWLLKDPALCITLRSWLPLLNSKPAVLLTYRHPLESALSLKKRQKSPVEDGIINWIEYNKYAIINSVDLCRVITSNIQLMANPERELKRIVHELTTSCQVPSPPKTFTIEAMNLFIDPTMQSYSISSSRSSNHNSTGVLEVYGKDNCVISKTDLIDDTHLHHYVRAMRLYCDMLSGEAFTTEYATELLFKKNEREGHHNKY